VIEQGTGVKVQGARYRGQGTGVKVQGARYRGQGAGPPPKAGPPPAETLNPATCTLNLEP